MKRYLTWIAGQMSTTVELVDAETGLEARKIIARRYRLDVTDACSRTVIGGLEAGAT
jgi:hypothetical protein